MPQFAHELPGAKHEKASYVSSSDRLAATLDPRATRRPSNYSQASRMLPAVSPGDRAATTPWPPPARRMVLVTQRRPADASKAPYGQLPGFG